MRSQSVPQTRKERVVLADLGGRTRPYKRVRRVVMQAAGFTQCDAAHRANVTGTGVTAAAVRNCHIEALAGSCKLLD